MLKQHIPIKYAIAVMHMGSKISGILTLVISDLPYLDRNYLYVFSFKHKSHYFFLG